MAGAADAAGIVEAAGSPPEPCLCYDSPRIKTEPKRSTNLPLGKVVPSIEEGMWPVLATNRAIHFVPRLTGAAVPTGDVVPRGRCDDRREELP